MKLSVPAWLCVSLDADKAGSPPVDGEVLSRAAEVDVLLQDHERNFAGGLTAHGDIHVQRLFIKRKGTSVYRDSKLAVCALHHLDPAGGENAEAGCLIRRCSFEVGKGDRRNPDLFHLLVSRWTPVLLKAPWGCFCAVAQARVLPAESHIDGAGES